MVALLGAGIATGHCPTTLSTWASYIVTGFRLGAIYAMIALGYTMVYGVLQLLNFAHSEVFMVGSFAGLYTLSKIFNLSSSGPGKNGAAVFLLLDGQKHLGLPWTWPNIAGRAPVGYPIWMARKTAFSVFGVGVANLQV